MKKDKVKGFISGMVVTTMIFTLSISAFAATGSKTIQVAYDNIKIYVNEKLTPMTTDGQTVEPFTYQGRTYVPLNAVATALGQKVGWDSATKSVYIGTQPAAGAAQPSATKPSSTSETLGQKNALKKADAYLSFSGFSYTGLIDQLEFEKFSHEDAVYAADHCGADWNEQAAVKAKAYLSFSGFSRAELIEQLEFEGFTREQAEYGAKSVGY